MKSTIRFAILHASDLHFGKSIDEEAGVPPLEISFPWDILDPLVQPTIQKKFYSHDPAIVLLFKYNLKRILESLREEGYRNNNFDLYIFSGDLSTYPSYESYNFISYFLFGGNFNDHRDWALGLSPEQVFIVPGNHDKFRDNNLGQFKQTFGSICASPHKGSSVMVSRTIAGEDFLFLLIDSNSYESITPLRPGFPFPFAKGNVSNKLLKEIKRKINALKRRQTIDEANISNYDRAKKFLILHHPVNGLGWQEKARERFFPHRCENIKDLCKLLKNDGYVILHGHMHKFKPYRKERLYCVDAGSASQLQKGKQNSLNILKLYESGSIEFEPWVWNRKKFVKDEKRSVLVS